MTHKLHILQPDYLGLDVPSIRHSLANHLNYTIAKMPITATQRDWFHAIAHTVRDRLIERWTETVRNYYQVDCKRVYYLSLEFLTGRILTNSMMNLGIYEECCTVLDELGLSIPDIFESEPEPALGNGGLGRLAACFLDSLASLRLPGYGYGIRYEYGMFYQRLYRGYQLEQPDNWLRYGNPWEFPRPEVLYQIHFGGHVVESEPLKFHWKDTEDVMAMAYDTPIPGYATNTVNNLRLWSAKSSRDFDLENFNKGDYIGAVENKNLSETLSKVLYPNDSTSCGRELRLKQEYFFVAASIQDILRRYLSNHTDLNILPDKIAIQLNDTHPTLAIPELLRLLIDRHNLQWDNAWDICTRIFSYTNHTLLPEALETWSVELLGRLLPRHLQIIYEINFRFLKEVSHRYPGNMDILKRLSIIGEEGEKHIRMAHLAIVGSHKVNGVAALHTYLMKTTVFTDFDQFYPDKIVNKTNGITPRRWLNEANQGLAKLLNQTIGKTWITDLCQLKQLTSLVDDPQFQSDFQAVKQANKQRLAEFIHDKLRIIVNPYSLFDVQVKRIHEYKRQLLNILHVITRYNQIRQNPTIDIVPRTVIFAGKAAPGYAIAKLIIKLINDVAEVINNDPLIGDKLKIIFIPNYDVSTAQQIIPAANLSEQISTAGTEASGTGNMKLALNGALTIGTLDGANIEIRDEVGEDNFFIFGMTAQEVLALRQRGYNPWEYYHGNQSLKQVIDMIHNGYFSPEESQRYHDIFEILTYRGDYFMLLADYADYIACQHHIDDVYRDQQAWIRKSILTVANMGKFSSDQTIREYAQAIWQVEPVAHE